MMKGTFKTTIHVTFWDIQTGKIHPCLCPIAQAIKRMTGIPVAVDTLSITFRPQALPYWKGAFSVGTPSAARAWMARYDRKQAVEPFSFSLYLPREQYENL